MNTELHLRHASLRADELRIAADRRRAARELRAATNRRLHATVRDLNPGPADDAWQSRLGWTLVTAGLHLLQRRTAQG
ncbi:hypothetical protein SAMN05421874_110212 [Nonomuraea maritima]|uniref:Uncharacterized protein n=1 Tax=Nonomuraea maritima TaxID=683260 RepID=A0A1G9EBI7_9ACTN|nr:hypothetical protein [Nonomuraea maritima]SDK73447.1 hypothetical protein SAMN05421874_110212 [Nonomuraea maritima]